MRVRWEVWYKQEEATYDTSSGIWSRVLKRPDQSRIFLSSSEGLYPGILNPARCAAWKNKQTELKSTNSHFEQKKKKKNREHREVQFHKLQPLAPSPQTVTPFPVSLLPLGLKKTFTHLLWKQQVTCDVENPLQINMVMSVFLFKAIEKSEKSEKSDRVVLNLCGWTGS